MPRVAKKTAAKTILFEKLHFTPLPEPIDKVGGGYIYLNDRDILRNKDIATYLGQYCGKRLILLGIKAETELSLKTHVLFGIADNGREPTMTVAINAIKNRDEIVNLIGKALST